MKVFLFFDKKRDKILIDRDSSRYMARGKMKICQKMGGKKNMENRIINRFVDRSVSKVNIPFMNSFLFF